MQTIEHLPTTASVKLHAIYEFKKNRSILSEERRHTNGQNDKNEYTKSDLTENLSFAIV